MPEAAVAESAASEVQPSIAEPRPVQAPLPLLPSRESGDEGVQQDGSGSEAGKSRPKKVNMTAIKGARVGAGVKATMAKLHQAAGGSPEDAPVAKYEAPHPSVGASSSSSAPAAPPPQPPSLPPPSR